MLQKRCQTRKIVLFACNKVHVQNHHYLSIFIVYSTRFSFAFVFISITLKILCTTLDYYKQIIQINYVTVYFSVNVCIHFL